MWDAFVAGMRDGTIPEAAIKTLIRLTFSFVVAVALGVALGLGLAFNEFARRAIRPLVVALQITPFVAWVPLAVIWFGVTERAVVFVDDRRVVPGDDARDAAGDPAGAAAVRAGRPHARRRRLGALPQGHLPGRAARA